MMGAVTTIGYDIGGRKTAMNDADMGAWSYTYNALDKG
jgi:YD repeat-containing protein